jgi:ATP-dependent DNA ligase
MTQRLSELKTKCRELGLTVTRSGSREARADYVFALRTHFLFRDFPDGCSFDELCPMLAFAYWDLRPDEQEGLWRDNNTWVAQEKFNGVRVILHFVKGVGVFAQTRVVSLKTYRRTDVTDRLQFSEFIPDFTTTVDCEVIVDKSVVTPRGKSTKSSLQSTTAILHMEPEASKRVQRDQEAPLVFNVFDITNWNGLNLRDRKLCERLGYLLDFRTILSTTEWCRYFNFPSVCFGQKKTFFDKIVAEGREGIVFKNLNSRYNDSERRSRTGWVKMKRQREFDAFVSGFGPGRPEGRYKNLVGYLIFSVMTEAGPHEIARIASLPRAFRKKITVRDPESRQVTLHPQMMGKVASLTGQEIAPRSFRLSHPKIVRWCRLGVKDQCTYSLAAIKG